MNPYASSVPAQAQHPLIPEDCITGSTLFIGQNQYTIIESELYSDDDPYTHHAVEQKLLATFYFHRLHGKGFKEGTYKGLDITMGDGVHCRAYLIRAIKALDGTITEGPCLVVNKILECFGYATVKTFYEYYKNLNPSLCITNRESGLSASLCECISAHASPRVGLKYKKMQDYTGEDILKFCMGYRRYIADSDVDKIKKQRKTVKLVNDNSSMPWPGAEELLLMLNGSVDDLVLLHKVYIGLCNREREKKPDETQRKLIIKVKLRITIKP